jgi:hypothetical protein
MVQPRRTTYSPAMPTLRARRAEASSYDPRFFERSAWFWPIAAPARAFAGGDDWPDVEALSALFEGEGPVRFVPASPRPRRRRSGPVDAARLYDARITNERCVRTRRRSWHDLLNAFVWASFPRAKRALHERQLHAMVERIPPGATHLPRTRTREHDALALIDEGGVVVLESADASPLRVIFGHALYEGLVLGVRAMIARAVVARVTELPDTPRARVALADAALEERLRAPRLVPEDLPRIAIDPGA